MATVELASVNWEQWAVTALPFILAAGLAGLRYARRTLKELVAGRTQIEAVKEQMVGLERRLERVEAKATQIANGGTARQ